MAGNYGNAAPRPTTILDERKLNLTAAPVQKGAKPPSMKLGVYRNNPQFTVFPNCDNGSGVNRISAGMNFHTFYQAMNLIIHLAQDNTPADIYSIANNQPIKKEERTDPNVRQKTVSETLIGKDEDGRMWISVVDRVNANAPKVKFYFQPDYYHSFRAKHGELDKGTISRNCAIAWAESSKVLVCNILAQAGVDPQNAAAGNGGGNKGGYQNNNGGGNYQKKPAYNSNGGSGGGASSEGFDDGDFSDFD